MGYEAIAWQSYMWGYPLVDMYMQREKRTSGYGSNGSNAPLNNFGYATKLNDDGWQTGLYPNCDLLYTMAHLDLSEPVVLAVPAVDPTRYWCLPIYDAYNHVCASFGPLQEIQGKTFEAGDYLIKGPSHHAETVAGEDSFGDKIVLAPTNYVWAAARTMVFADGQDTTADFPVAEAFTKQYKVTELKTYQDTGGQHKEQIQFVEGDDVPTEPVVPGGVVFFGRLREILDDHEQSWPERERFFAQQFQNLDLTDLEVIAALKKAEQDCQDFFESNMPGEIENDWLYMHALGAYQETSRRAHIALIGGAAANEAHEAFYPLGLRDSYVPEQAFKTTQDYSIVFVDYANNPVPLADEVRGYWSLTIYDDQRNPMGGLDFWSVGSRNLPDDPNDAVDELGNLTIHITRDRTKLDRPGHYYLYSDEAGAVDERDFRVCFRMYLPDSTAIREDGQDPTWIVPRLNPDA